MKLLKFRVHVFAYFFVIRNYAHYVAYVQKWFINTNVQTAINFSVKN